MGGAREHIVAVKVLDIWSGEDPSAATPSSGEDAVHGATSAHASAMEAVLALALSHPNLVAAFCHGSRVDKVGPASRLWLK